MTRDLCSAVMVVVEDLGSKGLGLRALGFSRQGLSCGTWG